MGSGIRTGAAIARPRRSVDTVGSPRSVNSPSLAGVPSFNALPGALAGIGSGEDGHWPEIDCIRSLLPADVLAAAQERADMLGVGADRVLIASAALGEEFYLRALAKSLGVQFEPLDNLCRTLCPISDERLIEAAVAGLLPVTEGDDLRLVVAPRGVAARRLVQLITESPDWAHRVCFTSAERLNRFILRCAGNAIADRASNALKHKWPELAAGPPRRRGSEAIAASAGLIAVGMAALIPEAAILVLELIVAALSVAWLALRVGCALIPALSPRPLPFMPAETLPVYSIIAALYREAASVDGLLRAIERLDYPPEKLDVILAVEADDRETIAAIKRRASRMPITVVAVPVGGPRTKPKALNVALPFARGSFTVVYDAEDRPEPDQLRRALHAFYVGDEALACVQARLCIDNTADGWLTRYFTAEYAGHFDVFLGGLASLQLPIPLGGSSNHFRTTVLRKIGGWDPYNVTEDADLGMRLARFGYRSDMIASTTHEEAPSELGPWLRQRTRWIKGWMQTWAVHMRDPFRLRHELGLPGFLSLQLIVGGNALAGLVHPFFAAAFLYAVVRDASPWFLAFYGSIVICGYMASAGLGCLGLARRGLLSHTRVLLLTPVHWLLLSLAAWRALYQLIVAPYAWEKTTHGLAKSSRRADQTTRALLQLDRHLRLLVETGDLPALPYGTPKKQPIRAACRDQDKRQG